MEKENKKKETDKKYEAKAQFKVDLAKKQVETECKGCGKGMGSNVSAWRGCDECEALAVWKLYTKSRRV